MAVPSQTIPVEDSALPGLESESVDPLTEESWDTEVAKFDHHTIFHRSAWARVLSESYGHRPVYRRFTAGGRTVALVPLMEVRSSFTGRRGVSLPFSDFAGPLWRDPRRAAEVHAELKELAADRGWKHLELRSGDHPPSGARPFQTYHAHQLDLSSGIDAVEDQLPSATRRAIRKAERSGLELTVNRNASAMDDFYSLHCRTRRRHGLPPQPREFFQAIGRNLIERDLGEVVLASHGGQPVAGAVFLRSGAQAVYKFGASDTGHWHLRPNQAVMWAAIRHLAGLGCHNLHFGRTSAADEGLIRFKHSWGSSSGILEYYRCETRSSAWIVAGGAPAESHPLIFGHLPIALNRFAGHLIYPHLD